MINDLYFPGSAGTSVGSAVGPCVGASVGACVGACVAFPDAVGAAVASPDAVGAAVSAATGFTCKPNALPLVLTNLALPSLAVHQ